MGLCGVVVEQQIHFGNDNKKSKSNGVSCSAQSYELSSSKQE
jgi:hypothetical protein